MRVVDVLAVPVRAGFFFDDQLAIRAGAGHDGFDYTGADFRGWCSEAGFRRFEVIHLAGACSAAVAYK